MKVIWHDVECGSYEADLALWEELAGASDVRVLDLGCGTGRVALHLAKRGHEVTGLDLDAALLAALEQRGMGLPVRAALGDARGFELEGKFGLALAPMQLVQLFATAGERLACLECIARHLRPGGLAALAIVDEIPTPDRDAGPPLPDVREIDGWVYSSLPIDSQVDSEVISIRRLRQTVSPDGELRDEVDEIELRPLSAATLEQEAAEAGLRAIDRRRIPPTDAHVGSTVVLLEKGT